jgi:hypothetical protein
MVLGNSVLVFDRPFWNALWVLFIVIPLFLIWLFSLLDVFSRDDLSGLLKVVWTLAILFLPFVGTCVYLIVRPAGGMETPWYGRPGTRTPGTAAEQLETLARLHDQGKLTDVEYAVAKSNALGTGAS